MAKVKSISDLDVVHVEILRKSNSLLTDSEIISRVDAWVNLYSIREFEEIIREFDNPDVNDNVSSIIIQKDKNLITNSLEYHIYSFNSSEIQPEMLQPIGTRWLLPKEDFHGLWESLFYETNIKNELFSYVSTAMLFSERIVNPNIIALNRIVFLHGPPGGGKKTLCKALAQKISIRFNSKFPKCYFIQVNGPSLFSMCCSDSADLLMKMFKNITTLLEDSKVFVVLLLDEVECLARSRTASLRGNEPFRTIVVVNALHHHLDIIKQYSNLLILTTANNRASVDVGFIDRADIQKSVGFPCLASIYQIYCTCIKELLKVDVITDDFRQSEWLYNSLKELDEALEKLEKPNMEKMVARGTKLRLIVEHSVGLSPRSLRNIPILACSMIKDEKITVEDFLSSLSICVQKRRNAEPDL